MVLQSFQILPDQKRLVAWALSGEVDVGTEQIPTIHLDGPHQGIAVWLRAKTAPVGADLIVDINEDGVSLFSTRPQINDGANEGGGSAVFSDTDLADNAKLTLDVDQVGSGTKGSDLTVILEVKCLG